MDRTQADQLLAANLSSLRAFVRLRANRAIRARESASDLVQSVCRELLEGVDKLNYESDAAFRSWLYTTALRKLVERDRAMHAQKRNVGREVPVGDAGDGVHAELHAAYASIATPSRAAAAKEQMELLEAAFDQMPEEYREVISLAKICGLSHREIGEQLGCSEEASRQLLRRAMVKLNVLLDAAES